MSNAIEAMHEVYEYLNSGDFAMAQCAVMARESEAITLPSSVFEKVLRLSIANDQLLPLYASWCERAFGRRSYASIVHSVARDLSL
jgi:hypothetical protein